MLWLDTCLAATNIIAMIGFQRFSALGFYSLLLFSSLAAADPPSVNIRSLLFAGGAFEVPFRQRTMVDRNRVNADVRQLLADAASLIKLDPIFQRKVSDSSEEIQRKFASRLAAEPNSKTEFADTQAQNKLVLNFTPTGVKIDVTVTQAIHVSNGQPASQPTATLLKEPYDPTGHAGDLRLLRLELQGAGIVALIKNPELLQPALISNDLERHFLRVRRTLKDDNFHREVEAAYSKLDLNLQTAQAPAANNIALKDSTFFQISSDAVGESLIQLYIVDSFSPAFLPLDYAVVGSQTDNDDVTVLKTSRWTVPGGASKTKN